MMQAYSILDKYTKLPNAFFCEFVFLIINLLDTNLLQIHIYS